MSVRPPRFEAFTVIALAGVPAMAQNVGPSTVVSPYVLPSRPGVSTISVLTVNDPASTIGGYRMVGRPDGLGALAGPGARFTLLMNHELVGNAGAVRAGGFTGAFVSRWEIEKATFKVSAGRDHNTAPADVTWFSQPPRSLNNLCSADLAAPAAYRFGTLGTDARIHLSGEEAGAEGTAWAHVVTGPAADTSWELPSLGRFSWENAVACPHPQQKTVVVGLDDSAVNGQVYVYVGAKTGTGNDIDRAGLTNGHLFGVRVTGTPAESRASAINTTFDLAPLGSQVNVTGAALNASSILANVTDFLRPEDGAWDPRPGHESDFYFVTTDVPTSAGGRSRLFRLSFTNLGVPELGGTITTLLEGTEGQEMFDNVAIDSFGRILIQEDINDARLCKIWLFDTATGSFSEVAASNPAFFQTGMPGFLTIDEEPSGITDAAHVLGDGWFLFDLQAHYQIPGELVEGGQLLALYVDPAIRTPVGVTSIGRASPGCNGPPGISVQSVPSAGNGVFELTCIRAPVRSLGIVVLGIGSVRPPLAILGMRLWVDPARAPVLALPVASDALGRGRVPLPIPQTAPVAGAIHGQFIWAGPSSPPPCPPLGVSASNAIRITIQP